MDILAIGEHRFVIQELVEEKPYTEAKISLFDDIVFRSEEKLNDLIENAEGLLNHLSSTGRLTGSIKELTGLDVKTLSFRIASISEFTYEEQQYFLEIKSSHERLKRAMNALSKIVERQRLTEEIRRIIGGNGHHPTQMLKRSEA
jgi:ATP-dependent Lon protease